MHTRTFLFILLVLLAACVASAQQGWNITGAGARAEGLGGAFIGVADDATAISWNPAGLGQLERSEFSIVGRWISEKHTFDSPSYPSFNEEREYSHFTYNFASIAFPLHAGKVNIVPAVAFQKRLDSYQDYSNTDEAYESSGGANTLTPGIGIKLHPMIHIGAAVNIWLGDFRNKTTTKTVSPSESDENSGSYKGLNYQAGLLIDFEGMKTPVPIKLGAMVRTPFDLEVDGDYTSKAGTETKGKFKNTVQGPLMYGFGASGRIGDNFTLALDFESRLYGDRSILRTTDGAPIDTIKLSDSEENLNQIRVGAEYLIVTGVGVIPLRAGFQTVPTLEADRVNGKFDRQVSGTGFSVGTGFIGSTIALDVTYSQSTWEKKFVSGTETIATQKYLSHTVSVSAIIYF